MNEANFAQFLDGAVRPARGDGGRLGIEPIGPSGALYPPEISDDGDDDVEAYLPSPVPSPYRRRRGVLNSEVPAARVAVLVHAGVYDTIADTYRSLGTWVAQHADPLPIPVREVYVVSYGETDDSARSAPRSTGPSTPGATPHEPHPCQHHVRLRRRTGRRHVLVGGARPPIDPDGSADFASIGGRAAPHTPPLDVLRCRRASRRRTACTSI